MSKPSPEQQRIESLERALEVAMYWLLRAYRSPNSFSGDYAGAMEVKAFLYNHGIDPTGKTGKALLKRPMEAYHHELEKAVKRATK